MSGELENAATVRISDGAIRRATGSTWPEWFTLLDAAGADTMTHWEIVAVVGRNKAVGRWWREMVAVAYERMRGRRTPAAMPAGTMHRSLASRT
jgi:hypothetical protein